LRTNLLPTPQSSGVKRRPGPRSSFRPWTQPAASWSAGTAPRSSLPPDRHWRYGSEMPAADALSR